MPQAKCSRCGAFYHGWALLNPRHQICSGCGAKLEITHGGTVFEGYSPFTAETLVDNKPTDVSPPPDKEPGRGWQKGPHPS
ncbi:hypothetical protein ACFLYR_01880 [Chloroflexota bacterium]